MHRYLFTSYSQLIKNDSSLEMPGIEPGAFHMQSERATTALHPLMMEVVMLFFKSMENNWFLTGF